MIVHIIQYIILASSGLSDDCSLITIRCASLAQQSCNQRPKHRKRPRTEGFVPFHRQTLSAGLLTGWQVNKTAPRTSRTSQRWGSRNRLLPYPSASFWREAISPESAEFAPASHERFNSVQYLRNDLVRFSDRGESAMGVAG